MPHAPFNLQDSLIAYGDDKRAAPVSWSLAELGDAAIDWTLGFAEFSADDSVHAHHIAKGEAFIVPRASWHRLRVLEPGRLLFFTPRAGTAPRPHAPETR